MLRTAHLSLVLALALATSATSAAEEVVLTPSRDTTLFSETDEAQKSNGSGEHLFTGKVANGALRRALIAFDVAAAIPPGSIITSARLTLTMSRTIVGASPVALHLLVADWGEEGSDAPAEEGTGTLAHPGDATWTYGFLDTMPWVAEGGDYAASARAVQSVGELGVYTWGPSPEMVADVQGWLDEPSRNWGWILVGSEDGEDEGTVTAKRFASRESSAGPDAVPALTLEFRRRDAAGSSGK